MDDFCVQTAEVAVFPTATSHNVTVLAPSNNTVVYLLMLEAHHTYKSLALFALMHRFCDVISQPLSLSVSLLLNIRMHA